MGGFLGSYLYQVDEKGRVTLPAAFRKGRDELAPFVLIKVHSDALTLYPEENWLDVEVRLREYARRTPRARHYALGLTSNATELTPDRQGRILIPERLREVVGITEEAMLVGALDKIEIWNPQRFETSIGGADDELGEMFAGIFA
ncbi:MAG: hypothetical protein M8841_00575 [marine benthic group bacterium]|nr:hypothetical protein [Gemmatimonadota bacterium]MCL7977079.1 hypothetical protein [Gemmatimonadota bacterium]